MAFPNNPPVDLDYLDFRDVEPQAIDVWISKPRRFLTAPSLATGRPLIIKSPTHTGRIAWLAKSFPDAKFIHLTRNPRDLFPSTCRLWKGLDEVQGLQNPRHDQLEPYVIDCLKRMYQAFHQQREQVESSRLIDVRYEDLVQDPVETLRRIYETLRLSEFDSVQPTIEQWVASEHQSYKRNRHQLSAEQEKLIRTHWYDYFERYGYH